MMCCGMRPAHSIIILSGKWRGNWLSGLWNQIFLGKMVTKSWQPHQSIFKSFNFTNEFAHVLLYNFSFYLDFENMRWDVNVSSSPKIACSKLSCRMKCDDHISLQEQLTWIQSVLFHFCSFWSWFYSHIKMFFTLLVGSTNAFNTATDEPLPMQIGSCEL